MLRIITLLSSLVIFTSSRSIAQDTLFAQARQAYHKEYINNPGNSPHIVDLLNHIGKEHHFTAICPTNGGEPKLLKNKGKALHLSPSPTSLHDWEPHSWSYNEETSTWKALCPGDSIYFQYNTVLDVRENCSPELDIPAWGASGTTNPWWVESEENGIQSNGSVYTYLGSDGLFDKPLILVEGFDFLPGSNTEEHRHGGFGWRDIWGCNTENYPGTQNYPIMLDSLHNEGYDIVFVDFEFGTSSIEHKSILVQHTIRLCNDFKCSNSSNVIIGASMGGVVARHSLTTMEHCGESHCCRVYASIDSPHRGANISPGLQAIVHLLATPSSEAAIFSNGLNTPAAKQLLHFNFDAADEYIQAQQMLNNLGYPKGTTNLAIANSHPEVEVQLETAPLLNWSNYYFPIGTAHLIANRTTEAAEGFQQIAACALPTDFTPLNGVPTWYEETMYYYNDGQDHDIIPSSLGRHMGSLVNAINASGALSIDESQYQDACGFISYQSALDINENGFSPFDRYHNAEEWEAPEEHVELSIMHRKLLLDNIILGDQIAPAEINSESLQSYFEYGENDLHTNWIGNTHIGEGGTVAIGDSESLIAPCNTRVKTRPCESIIDISEGGTLRVGSTNTDNTGELILNEGSLLSSYGENNFMICTGSKLVIDNNAIMILDGSTLKIGAEASLLIETGGILILKNGASITLEGNTSSIQNSGKIVIEGDDDSHINSYANVSTSINFNSNSIVETTSNSKLVINGGNVLQISVANDSFSKLNGTGRVEINNTDLHIQSNSHILSESRIYLNKCRLFGDNGGSIKSSNSISIDECIWSNVQLVMLNAGVKSLKSSNSEFDNSEFNLSKSGVALENNYFYNSNIISNESVGPNHINNNIFNSDDISASEVIKYSNGSGLFLSENNFIEGNVACRFINSPITLKCNQFKNLNDAIQIVGSTFIRMNPQNGGGYNHFINNRTHLVFEEALFPEIQNGLNSFGAHGVNCFSGSVSEFTPYWAITGNNWPISSLSYGSSGGVLSSCVWHSYSSLPIEVIISTPSDAAYHCPEYLEPVSDNSGKSLQLKDNYDVLGRSSTINNAIISKTSENGQGQLNILLDPSLK